MLIPGINMIVVLYYFKKPHFNYIYTDIINKKRSKHKLINNIMYDGTYIKNSKKPFVLWDSIRYDGFVRGNENRIGYNWRFNGIEHMIMLALDADKDVCYRSVISKSVNNWEDVKLAQKELPVEYIIKSLQSEWKNGTNSQTMFVPLDF